MSSNHIMRVVDNDRHHEAEGADALLKFSNLLLAVPTRVFWVQLEIGRIAVSKRNLRCGPIHFTTTRIASFTASASDQLLARYWLVSYSPMVTQMLNRRLHWDA